MEPLSSETIDGNHGIGVIRIPGWLVLVCRHQETLMHGLEMKSMTEKRLPMALTGKAILSFSLERWSDVWRSRHHIMAQLARENRVLFGSRPYYIWDVFRPDTHGASSGVNRISNNLYTYVPPRWLPVLYRYPALQRKIKSYRCLLIRRAMDRLGLKQPILYIWHPSFVDMVGCFSEALTVYHVYDEYNSFDGEPAAKALLASQERALLERADIVFTSAEATYERRKVYNPNIHVVRNGVDYRLFSRAQDADTSVPEDLLRIPRPIIGCVATQTNFMDLALLTQIFQRRPDWSFVFIGVERAPDNQAGEVFGAFE